MTRPVKQLAFNLLLLLVGVSLVLMLADHGWWYSLLAVPFLVLIALGLIFLRVAPEDFRDTEN